MAQQESKKIVVPSPKKEEEKKTEPSALPQDEGQAGNFFENHPGGNPPPANKPASPAKSGK